jgi:hypothetical protein
MTGKGYKYRPISEDRFILYSVGWNEVDDSGKSFFDPGDPGFRNLALGDWTWQYSDPQN